MADKKISELPVASSIDPSYVSVLVSSDTDYQYSFSTLLSYVAANLSVGSKNSFGTTIPQNTTGNNGDVFFKTDTTTFYQKVNGIWTLAYTIPTGSGPDGTLIYGIGQPGSIIGANNDTYIDTNTGIFYLKTSGTWAKVYSMANGPQGPQGTAGINGTNGTNGNTILNGSANPDNASGNNGDFYLNTSTYLFFGPKISGAWPTGNSIIGDAGPQGPSGATFDMTAYITAAPVYDNEAAAVAAGLAPYTMYKTSTGELRYKLPASGSSFTYSIPFTLS